MSLCYLSKQTIVCRKVNEEAWSSTMSLLKGTQRRDGEYRIHSNYIRVYYKTQKCSDIFQMKKSLLKNWDQILSALTGVYWWPGRRSVGLTVTVRTTVIKNVLEMEIEVTSTKLRQQTWGSALLGDSPVPAELGVLPHGVCQACFQPWLPLHHQPKWRPPHDTPDTAWGQSASQLDAKIWSQKLKFWHYFLSQSKSITCGIKNILVNLSFSCCATYRL